MGAPSPALAAAMVAEGMTHPAPLSGGDPGAPGAPGAPVPGAEVLDKKKITAEIAASLYGGLMLGARPFPTIGKECTPEDAEEVAVSLVAAFDAWGVLHLLKGGKYMLSIQAIMAAGALMLKVKGAIEIDVRNRAAVE